MKLACFTKNPSLLADGRVSRMVDDLRDGGCPVCNVSCRAEIEPGTDMLLSVGGDGTFLSAASLAGDSGLPVLGVNLGRLGFLSFNKPETVASSLLSGNWHIENRVMLTAECGGRVMTALNEISVSRVSKSMLGIDVELDGRQLPTYWADGLLVSTSSGSTAYSLSAGGPVCLPQTDVLIIAPVAPHNLNLRPLVVPDTSVIRLGFRSRDGRVILAADNSDITIDGRSTVTVRSSERMLRTVELGGSSFIDALRTRLLWGEDVRNNIEDKYE